MNINIVFVIGAGPLLNSKSSIRDKIKHTIISDWQGLNLPDFFFFQQFKEKDYLFFFFFRQHSEDNNPV